jgi:hypothetical protein
MKHLSYPKPGMWAIWGLRRQVVLPYLGISHIQEAQNQPVMLNQLSTGNPNRRGKNYSNS